MSNTSSPQKSVVPVVPAGLTVQREDFLGSEFSVDLFLTRWHSKSAVTSGPSAAGRTLETLRDDLGIYLKVLRSAMIELINEDYADFVNLSTNLVGLDKTIEGLKDPLLAYKVTAGKVRDSLTSTLEALHAKLERREFVYKQKTALQNLEHITHTLAKVERLLGLQTQGQGQGQTVEMTGDLVERVAAEINYLNFCVSKCQASNFVEQMRPRLKVIGDHLHGSLESQLLDAISEGQSDVLKRCLRIFATVDRVRDAEKLVRARVIHPFLEPLISEVSISENPQGWKGVLEAVLKVIPEKLSVLLQLTSGSKENKIKENGVVGMTSTRDFNFLVNSFWPEFVELVEDNVAFVFSAGNPEKFFTHYTVSMDFLASFEAELGNLSAVENFRSQESYSAFMSRWNLPVYFQIRFQEIALPVETGFSNVFAEVEDSAEGNFRLQATEVAWQALSKTWAENVFLPALAHRFWKLTLQIISRYSSAVSSAPDSTFEVVKEEEAPKMKHSATSMTLSSSRNTGMGPHSKSSADLQQEVTKVVTFESYRSRPNEIITLWLDVEDFAVRIESDLANDIMEPRLGEDLSEDANLNQTISKGLADSCAQLREELPLLSDIIVKSVSEKCLPFLRQVADIPRLYRRTNRDIPTKPCTYMLALLSPITAFRDNQLKNCPAHVSKGWMTNLFNVITDEYVTHVAEVLAAVQKMEESLRRLKRVRDNRTGNSEKEAEAGKKAVSDDDKIRLQLLVDVSHFVRVMGKEYGVEVNDVEQAEDLLKHVNEATETLNEGKRLAGMTVEIEAIAEPSEE